MKYSSRFVMVIILAVIVLFVFSTTAVAKMAVKSDKKDGAGNDALPDDFPEVPEAPPESACLYKSDYYIYQPERDFPDQCTYHNLVTIYTTTRRLPQYLETDSSIS